MFEFSLIYGFDFICKMIGREKPKYFEYYDAIQLKKEVV